jgi:hypothetical protein
MSIQEHLNKIRNAIKGSEIRESIAKGIETAYDDASEKHDNANMEVKIARGTNPNLNTRLNKMDETDRRYAEKIDSNYNEITEQLSQTEQKLNKKVGLGVLASMGDLSQEVKTAMTGGSVAVVGEGSVTLENLANDVRVKVDEIDYKSNNIVMNNLAKNGSFEDIHSSAWEMYSASFSTLENLSGERSARVHSAGTSNPEVRQRIAIPTGHSFYFKAYTKIIDAVNGVPSISIADYNNEWANLKEFQFDTSTMNEWQSVSGIATSNDGGITFRLIFRGLNINATAHFDDVAVIDLTDLFGLGNEPTKEEFEKFLHGQGWGEDYQLRLEDLIFSNPYSSIVSREIASFDVEETEKKEHLPLKGAAGLNVNVEKMARGNFSVMGSVDGNFYQPLEMISKSTGNKFNYVHHPDRFYIDTDGYNFVTLETRILYTTGSAKVRVTTTTSENKPTENRVSRFAPVPLNPYSYRTDTVRSITPTSIARDGTWYGVSGTVLEKSTDYGDSWSEIYRLDTSDRAAQIHVLEDGTLLLITQNGRILKSNVSHTEFEEKVQMASPDIKMSSRFGVNIYSNLAFVAEYGDKNGTNPPRRVYMSDDFGETWRVIFEPEVRSNYHTHDVAYDPYEDIVWVVNGDGVENSNVHYSTDFGDSWTTVYIDGECPNQFTSILPMSNCVLFLSDNRHDGVYRWDRIQSGIASVDQILLEPAYTINRENDGPEMIGNRGFVDYAGDGAAYFGYAQFHTNVKDPAIVYATRNGYDFYKIWNSDYMPFQDTQGFIGISGVDGIDDEGHLVVGLSGAPSGEGRTLRLKVPKWVRV